MTKANEFAGAWHLVSTEFRNDDDSLAASPYGSEPQGILMYDAQGNMSAQLSQNYRHSFANPDRLAGTAQELKSAFETYQAYCGRYRVDERERVVIHTVTLALLPNWVGTEQRRHYEFKDSRLILRTSPFMVGGKPIHGELVWERI